jgi:lipoprotein-anchoring transpeptidase ErfK/SrfK
VRHPSFLGVVAVLAALCVLGGGVLVLDHQAKEHLAKGVRIGGVDVGGLKPAAARAKLRHELLPRLHRPIIVHHDTRTFEISAKTARITVDINRSVDEAMARSQDGNPIGRALRQLTGGRIHASIAPQLHYSHKAVTSLVGWVESSLARPARDASLKYTGTSIAPVSGQIGLAVKSDALQANIEATLERGSGSRTFVVGTRRIMPGVTTAQLAKHYPAVITIDRSTYQLRLYRDLKLAKTYPIAVGMIGLETPAGLYHIQNKAVNPAWSVPNSPWTGKLAGTVVPGGAVNNPIKARWLGIYAGAGIHGIDPSEYGTIGHSASHGCIRMRIPDVEELYPQVPIGAPIYIA